MQENTEEKSSYTISTCNLGIRCNIFTVCSTCSGSLQIMDRNTKFVTPICMYEKFRKEKMRRFCFEVSELFSAISFCLLK